MMYTQIKNQVRFLIVVAIAALTVNISLADDLNPPAYRGDPLSVHAHWQNIDGTAGLTLVDFSSQDDADPTTTLHPLQPSDYITPTADKIYQFDLPNFIDKLPIKYMRLQLTWTGDATAPSVFDISGVDDGSLVPGAVVFTSPVDPLATGAFYQYYDIEFKPNPDFERWLVHLSDNNFLVQAVADTVSTVPEPATLSLLAMGSIAFFRRRK